MPRAELPDEIADTARDGPDEELDRTQAGILAAVSLRLIGHDPMLSTDDIVASAGMIRD
jgi:hypothetical protein